MRRTCRARRVAAGGPLVRISGSGGTTAGRTTAALALLREPLRSSRRPGPRRRTPNERVQGPQWWTAYQPVSYGIATRPGDRTAFKRMIDTCHAAGVEVVVDTVINHLADSAGTGTGGSPPGARSPAWWASATPPAARP
ncbi:alpha-amylase family glycosyl hydrolase [Streptomyces fradiae]|uniref:alpha-amylase family glycosyl hydrolase n=1 Tax=Streptomyces fradiae TaxID=1906 RepID=UPI003F4D6908